MMPSLNGLGERRLVNGESVISFSWAHLPDHVQEVMIDRFYNEDAPWDLIYSRYTVETDENGATSWSVIVNEA